MTPAAQTSTAAQAPADARDWDRLLRVPTANDKAQTPLASFLDGLSGDQGRIIEMYHRTPASQLAQGACWFSTAP